MQSVEKGVNVNIVILKNSTQILLVKNKARWKEIPPDKKFFKPSKWGIPNGRKKQGENEIETAVRETREETGFQVEIEPSIRVEEDAGDHTNITFLGRIISGEIKIPPEEIIACNWFSINSLPSPMYFSHQGRIQQLLKKLREVEKR